MIRDIDPRGYDVVGLRTPLPKKKRLHFHPTFAMGTYLTRPGDCGCENLEDIRQFLVRCRYVSDPKQFGVRDYWMHPDDFEKRRAGDCDDFALWTWSQLVRLGFDARFVIGTAGYARRGHAWVTFRRDGADFLFEPLAARRRRLTRIGAMMYYPKLSVAWDGTRLLYFEHEEREFTPSLVETVAYAVEWVPRFMWGSLVRFVAFPWRLWRQLRRRN